MKRKICVVTGSRAEYGLLRWVMEEVRSAPNLQLQVVVTGMHLAPEFGMTSRAVEQDGFSIDRKIEALLSSDTPVGVAKSIGLGVIGFADALRDLAPDVMVVLGDRFEILAAVAAALPARIPVAHIHGGEVSEGAFDDAIRHSITKMSHLHFVAAEEYRRRVVQLGEQPDRVFVVGGLALDGVGRIPLLDRSQLEQELGLPLGRRNLVVTFHPVTLDDGSAQQFGELLAALDQLRDTNLYFTLPNADTGGRELAGMVQSFVQRHPNARYYTSLGQRLYYSCLKHMDGVVGNSSSGLIEAPAFRKGTVNIGDRQHGRLRAESVIDCAPARAAVMSALERLWSAEFQRRLGTVRNPYGDGGASERITRVLESCDPEKLTRKSFYDVPLP